MVNVYRWLASGFAALAIALPFVDGEDRLTPRGPAKSIVENVIETGYYDEANHKVNISVGVPFYKKCFYLPNCDVYALVSKDKKKLGLKVIEDCQPFVDFVDLDSDGEIKEGEVYPGEDKKEANGKYQEFLRGILGEIEVTKRYGEIAQRFRKDILKTGEEDISTEQVFPSFLNIPILGPLIGGWTRSVLYKVEKPYTSADGNPIKGSIRKGIGIYDSWPDISISFEDIDISTTDDNSNGDIDGFGGEGKAVDALKSTHGEMISNFLNTKYRKFLDGFDKSTNSGRGK